MAITVYPDKYLLFNEQQSKALNVVVRIEGSPDDFSLFPTFTRVRYGDPHVKFGDPGLIWGGLRKLGNVRSYLSMESAISITQRLEPEQGRASVSTLSLVFIDKDGYMSKLVSPGGGIITEILGSKDVQIFLGYQKTSFPEDYFTVYRGVVSGVVIGTGKVTLKLSDPNQRRKSKICQPETVKTTGAVMPGDLIIPVGGLSSKFYTHILGPNGAFDTSVKTFAKIEDEFMQYLPGGNVVFPLTVSRGQRGTAAVAHAAGEAVTHSIELSGHAIDLALKVMLSGWAGPWKTSVPCSALGTTTDPLNLATNVILLLPLINADTDYGLVAGDYITISGSTAGNNQTVTIVGFADVFGNPNRSILISAAMNLENPASSVLLAFRSKYDTLPKQAGCKLDPTAIDVKGHELLKSRYLSGTEYQLRIFIPDSESGKDFIEQEFYRPLGAYALTRYGRLSVGFTRPPLPGDHLVFLDSSNVKDPGSITVTRDMNSRTFFNEIKYEFDATDDGKYESVVYTIDTDSANDDTGMGIVSTLPIQARGVKTDLNGALLATRRSNGLLSRYKRAAYDITLKVFWKVASVIESGDVVVLTDNGGLKITNLDTGERTLGQQIFEVVDRKLNMSTGDGELKLRSGLGTSLSDRYATWAPSSKIIAAGSSTTKVRIKESYGGFFPGAEWLKWVDYVGLRVRIHDNAWTYQAEVVFSGIDTTDPFTLTLATALPFTPSEDDVIDLAQYPNTTDKTDQELAKLLHAFFTPSLVVVTGLSPTSFTLSAPDAAKIQLLQPIKIHNANYSVSSPESKVLTVVGVTVTVETALGFTPAAGQKVELVGFKDGGGAYRWV